MVNLSTVGNVVVKIAIVISISQLLILFILGSIPHTMSGETVAFTHLAFLALLNMALLVITTSPFIYFWVINPFVKARDEAVIEATRLAHYDQLTNLGNRRLIYQNLEKIKAQCDRREVFGAVMLLDLNKFKPINDEYGHDAGDAILVSVANQLIKVVRSEDLVGRFGGDEFVVVISYLDSEESIAKDKAQVIAQKIQSAVRKPVDFNGSKIDVCSSIGICLFKKNDKGNDELIKMADTAMYKAKTSSAKIMIC